MIAVLLAFIIGVQYIYYYIRGQAKGQFIRIRIEKNKSVHNFGLDLNITVNLGQRIWIGTQ